MRPSTQVTKVGQFTERLVKEISQGIDGVTRVLDSQVHLPTDIVTQLGEVSHPRSDSSPEKKFVAFSEPCSWVRSF